MLANGVVAMLFLGLIVLGGLFPTTIPGAPATPSLRAAALTMPGLAASAPMAAVTSLEAAPVPLTVVAPPVTAEALLAAADSTQTTLSTLQQVQRDASVPAGAISSREPERIPLYYRYEVQPGDTITSIANRFGTENRYITWNNIDVVEDADLLAIGLVLQIPSVPGIIYDVRVGETLTDIAVKFDAKIDEIMEFPANNLSDPNLLREGSRILVVNGEHLPPPAPTLRPAFQPQFVDREPSDDGFVWPLVGEITSWMNAYHPLGIDINALMRTPIAAVAAGQVTWVGGDPCCSYGLYVELDHGDGYTSLYAHLDSFAVVQGEWVERGQIIGSSGNSGRSTGPHLHFEISRFGLLRNPLTLLY